MKEQASANWRLAMLIAADVGSIFGSKKPPSLYDAYPELFEQEAKEAKWKAYQAQMIAYAEMYNIQRNRQKQEDL